MSKKRCKELVSELSNQQLDRIVKEAEEFSSFASKKQGDPKLLLKDFIQTRKESAIAERAQSLLTAEKVQLVKTRTEQKVFKDDAEGLSSILETTTREGAEGGATIWNTRSNIEDTVYSRFTQLKLASGDLFKAFAKGDKDLDIRVARVIIEKAEDENEAINEIAKALRSAYDEMYNLKLESGYDVGKLSDYIGRQYHNTERMLDLGEEAWKDLARDSFDFDNMQVDNIEAFLTDMWNSRTTERMGSPMPDLYRFEKSRKVIFNGAESLVNYNEVLGNPGLFENLIRTVDNDAGVLAASRVLGPKFDRAWKSLLDSKDITQKQRRTLQREYDYALRGKSLHGQSLTAKVGGNLRAFIGAGKLGQALISTITDYSFGAGIRSSLTGDNILSSGMKMFNSSLKNVSEKNRLEFVKLVNVMARENIGATYNARFLDETQFTGLAKKGVKFAMDMTGLNLQSTMVRTGNASEFAFIMSKQLEGEDFGKLYKGSKEFYRRHGIDEQEWNVLKQTLSEVEPGVKVPEIDRIFDEDITSDLFKGKSKKQIDKIKRDISFKFQTTLRNAAEFASPTPKLSTLALPDIVDPDTFIGQAWRFMLQFKSFPLESIRTMKFIGKHGTGDKHFNSGLVASTAISSSMLGYLAIASKDMINGRDPRNPFDPQTMLESFVQGGSGGLFVDFLARDYTKSYNSIIKDLAGPVPTTFAEPIAKFMSGAGKDSFNFLSSGRPDFDGTLEGFIDILDKASPNTPILKPLLFKKVIDQMYLMVNPQKHKKRMRRRERRRREDLRSGRRIPVFN